MPSNLEELTPPEKFESKPICLAVAVSSSSSPSKAPDDMAHAGLRPESCAHGGVRLRELGLADPDLIGGKNDQNIDLFIRNSPVLVGGKLGHWHYHRGQGEACVQDQRSQLGDQPAALAAVRPDDSGGRRSGAGCVGSASALRG